jgi:hypothetical protein
MALPEPDYLNMLEAAERLKVSLQRTRWLISKDYLKAYVPIRIEPYDGCGKVKYQKIFDIDCRMIPVKSICWVSNDSENVCGVATLEYDDDQKAAEIGLKSSEVIDSYSIMLKKSDIDVLLEQHSEPVQSDIKTVFSPEEHIERMISEGKSQDEITIELVEQYGTKREKYYGLIARKFCENDINLSNGAWRSRGMRMYQAANKKPDT